MKVVKTNSDNPEEGGNDDGCEDNMDYDEPVESIMDRIKTEMKQMRGVQGEL